jgi:hypothetical protein
MPRPTAAQTTTQSWYVAVRKTFRKPLLLETTWFLVSRPLVSLFMVTPLSQAASKQAGTSSSLAHLHVSSLARLPPKRTCSALLGWAQGVSRMVRRGHLSGTGADHLVGEHEGLEDEVGVGHELGAGLLLHPGAAGVGARELGAGAAAAALRVPAVASFCCGGVLTSSVATLASLILPMAVEAPVPMTSPRTLSPWAWRWARRPGEAP